MNIPPVLATPLARLMELDQESVFALADIAAERVRHGIDVIFYSGNQRSKS